jgi:hypothetical protein
VPDRNVDIVQPSRNAVVYLPEEALDLTDYPIKDGWFEEGFNNDLTESDPEVAWPGIEYKTETIFGVTQEWKFPSRFKAIHCSLIPKGPHRGRLLLWDASPVIAKCTATGSSWWSWQCFVILDLDPDAEIRCRNYMIPINPVVANPAPPFGSYYLSLFCSGHAWTENGDLVIAGGNAWPDLATTYSYPGLWIWNPDHAGAAGIPLGGYASPSAPTFIDLNVAHYADFGALVYHGQMKRSRWYPSVKTTPRYNTSPYTDQSAVLVFGGLTDPSNFTIGGDPGSKSYEAFRVTASPVCNGTTVSSGLSQDLRAPAGASEEAGVFYGPISGTIVEADMFERSLIYYAHLFQLTNGSFFMSGMAEDPATLTNHETSPGVWVAGPGDNPPAPWDRERMYSSSVLAPNYDGEDNKVIIFGGANYFPTAGGVNESTATCRIIRADNAASEWEVLPDGNYPSTEQNLVVAPDADIYLFGGANKQITAADDGGGSPGGFTSDLHTKPQRLSIKPSSLTSFDDGAKWELLSWTPSEAYRDYHSTAMLMPDGRIFTGGGDSSTEPIDPDEPSHAHNPTASDHPGYDYEMFYPRYLRPSEVSAITFARPTNVTITTNTGGAVSQDASGCYLLTYHEHYHATVESVGPFRQLSHVVLMAPGSKTHHIDFSEIYYKPHTQSLHSQFTVSFRVPLNDLHIPRGYYMLFVLDDNRVPSEAIWIKL